MNTTLHYCRVKIVEMPHQYQPSIQQRDETETVKCIHKIEISEEGTIVVLL
jgi:hypothetical protein